MYKREGTRKLLSPSAPRLYWTQNNWPTSRSGAHKVCSLLKEKEEKCPGYKRVGGYTRSTLDK